MMSQRLILQRIILEQLDRDPADCVNTIVLAERTCHCGALIHLPYFFSAIPYGLRILHRRDKYCGYHSSLYITVRSRFKKFLPREANENSPA